MTQPVQEPSQGRTDSGQEYRTRQLFRRPAPSFSALPTFRIQQRQQEAQTITATAEMLLSPITAVNTDATTFAYDAADPAGVLILRSGLYGFFAAVRVQSSYIAVARAAYNAAQPLSSGAGAGIGNELGETWFSVGAGQGISSLGEVPAAGHSKSVLNHMAITQLTDPASDPWRAVVILQYATAMYVTSDNLRSSLTVVRIGDF